MKNTYWIVLVIIVFGLVFFLGGKDNKLEAPASGGIEENLPVSNTQPAIFQEGEGEVGEVKEFTITATNFAFSPSTINVKKGDRVKIIFKNTQGFHDFVVDEFGAATKKVQAPTEEVLEFTADKTGTFEYYCSVGTHRQMGMKGVLTVSE